MTRAGMWSHIALCAVALSFAWVSAHRVAEKKGGPSSVTLLDVEPGEIAKVTYRWDKGQTETTLSGAGAARRATVKVDRQLPPKKPDDKKPDDKKPDDKKPDDKKPDGPQPDTHVPTDASVPPADVAEPTREVAVIPGGKVVLTAVAALEPLKTKRTLGPVDDAERLTAMGLSPPVRRLEVTAGARSLTLEIGEASFGAQGRYARVVGSRDVHLIDGAIVTGLEGGVDALLEKRLVPAELDAIVGFTVRRGDKTAAFVHVDRDQASVRFVASKDDPTTKKEAAGKALSTLRNLRGNALVSADVAAQATSIVAAAVIETETGPLFVELVERGDQPGSFVLRSGGTSYEATATQARELQDDLDAALGE
jgi:hypothetical protein